MGGKRNELPETNQSLTPSKTNKKVHKLKTVLLYKPPPRFST